MNTFFRTYVLRRYNAILDYFERDEFTRKSNSLQFSDNFSSCSVLLHNLEITRF